MRAVVKVEHGLVLDVVVPEGAASVKLLASTGQQLLTKRSAFGVLDLVLDFVKRWLMP